MTAYTAPLKDMAFVMNRVLALEAVAALPGYEAAEPALVEQVLAEANRLARDVLAPLNPIGDRQGSRLENGVVRTPDGFRDAYGQFTAGGWNGVPFDPDYGGQGLPWLVQQALAEMWQAANMSFGLCPLLTQGAIELLHAHGTDAQKALYLPKMIEGAWTGTMNLTEPQAGSDVGAVKTRAVPQGDGTYRITGQKIYITYGDHDWTDNVIHMVLARLPDAPEGTKGISLFLVPKYLVNPDGSLGARNDLRAVSLEHKLGINASPTCVMAFGDDAGAVGYLVGPENRGMECMFTMMNNARLAVGTQGLAIAERAYQQALDYAKTRLQSRDIAGSAGPVAIIKHPDVRRMLMSMKSGVEAMRGLSYYAAWALDHAKLNPDEAARQRAQRMIDLLTPIVKAWCTDLGVEIASIGVQIHGGMGFIEETGAAQHYRDARILPIYEGTNGIQANDLVGRKIVRDEGVSMRELIAAMRATLAEMQAQPGDDAEAIAIGLDDGIDALELATDWLLATFPQDRAAALAGAAYYLKLAGTVIGGWMLARGALAALEDLGSPGPGADSDFLEAKLITARFYAEHSLAQSPALLAPMIEGGRTTLALADAQF
ncbi:acyl-CoA dehydrogenase [Oceanibaculum pacificum]|uniref:3-methylmercaptopropionyl-CoA dehydrogenase n=1 Tax=Oceanibaculum pacificum TaxID=580166 RepID=A0A154WFH5_9PROT|nr:acyl-CoA dehydrogenase [Oceanibaculum pacificum]KZD12283.1 acyl-CoA dehydrogenase [Oceanibaculum pacificum]